jgi:hypothetical protein
MSQVSGIMIKGYVSLHVPNLSGFPLSRIDSHTDLTDLTEMGMREEGRGKREEG